MLLSTCLRDQNVFQTSASHREPVTEDPFSQSRMYGVKRKTDQRSEKAYLLRQPANRFPCRFKLISIGCIHQPLKTV